MIYEKHHLLGTRKDGRPPRDGKVKAPIKTSGTMPISHDHERDYDRVANTGNIARDTTKKSVKRSVVRAHDQMHHRTGGALSVGISKTTAAALDDEAMAINPVVAKRTQVAAAEPVVGHRRRAFDLSGAGAVGENIARGRAIEKAFPDTQRGLQRGAAHIDQAIDNSRDSTHPRNLARRK